MHRHFSPKTIAAPFGRYHHAVEVVDSARWLFLSGQLGITADGQVPQGCEAQTRLIFEAIDRCLEEAVLHRGNLVRLNAYLVEPEDRLAYMKVRDAYVGDPPPASTLLFVKALARPEFLVEVEAIAAAD